MQRLISIAILLSGAYLTGCTALPSARFGSPTYERHRVYIHPRVEADGFKLRMPFTVRHWEKDHPEVLITTAKGWQLAWRSLIPWKGSQPPIPILESEVEDSLPPLVELNKTLDVFVPYSRLAEDRGPECKVLVTSYTSPDSLVDEGRFSLPEEHVLPAIWTNLKSHDASYKQDNGSLAFHAALEVQMYGLKGRQIFAVGVIHSDTYEEFSPALGGPIRVRAYRLNAKSDDARFDLDFRIPYARLAHLPRSQRVVLTPSLEIDGKLVYGNIHYHFLAGGRDEEFLGEVDGVLRSYDAILKSVDQDIDALGGKTAKPDSAGWKKWTSHRWRFALRLPPEWSLAAFSKPKGSAVAQIYHGARTIGFVHLTRSETNCMKHMEGLRDSKQFMYADFLRGDEGDARMLAAQYRESEKYWVYMRLIDAGGAKLLMEFAAPEKEFESRRKIFADCAGTLEAVVAEKSDE